MEYSASSVDTFLLRTKGYWWGRQRGLDVLLLTGDRTIQASLYIRTIR
jgi:hypothetical protein